MAVIRPAATSTETGMSEYPPTSGASEPTLPSPPGSGHSARTFQESSSANGTVFPSPPIVARLSSSAKDTDDCLSFLHPPQAPGELGRLGPYRVLNILGSGGMGVVFLAEDPQLRRLVALKAMKPLMIFSTLAKERFLREAQAMAALRHDHIVTVYQVGEDRGIPYLAMEHLEGEPLDARLTREDILPLADVLRFGRETAQGLAAAHERGLIHRDIKPSNLWLERRGGRQRIKILDFGLARSAGGNGQPLTDGGVILGTPGFMAPEQGHGEDVDERSDLFSLGCVLYRMCTGRMPFQGRDMIETLLAASSQIVKPPAELMPGLPPALNDLILQLLAKEPGRRPASAQAVVHALEDIEEQVDEERFRATEEMSPTPRTVAAAAPSRHHSLVPPRSFRRWAVATGLVCLLLVLGVAYGGDIIRYATNKGELVIEVDDPQIEVTIKQNNLTVFDRSTNRQFELTAGKGEIEVFEPATGLRMTTKQFTLTRGGTARITVRRGDLVPPKKPLPATSAADALRRETIPPYELQAAGDGDPARAPAELVAVLGDSRLKHWGVAVRVAVSKDGKFVASVGWDKSMRLWDAATGQQVRIWRDFGTPWVDGVALSPDGKLAATYNTGGDTTLRLWDLATGKQLALLRGHTGQLHSLTFSPDGTLLASASEDGTARLWSVAARRELHTLRGHTKGVHGVTFHPQGKVLATASADQTVRLWDVATGKDSRTLEGFAEALQAVEFSPDGTTLAVLRTTGDVQLWDVAKAEKLTAIEPATDHFYVLRHRPGSPMLALAGQSGKVSLWHLTQGGMHLLDGHRHLVPSLSFSGDGTTLASCGSFDGTVRLWDAATGKDKLPTAGHRAVAQCVAVSPDGKQLATGGMDGTVKVWDFATGQELLTLPHEGPVRCVAFSPDGKTLAAADNTARLWEAATGKPLRTLEAGCQVHCLAFAPDGRHLAGSGDEAGKVLVWDTATWEVVRSLAVDSPGGFHAVAFSPNGKHLAAGGSGEAVICRWEWEATRELPRLRGHQAEHIDAVAFSPDGKWLVSGGRDGTVKAWHAADGQLGWSHLARHAVRSLSFSGDSAQLAFACEGGEVVLLAPASGLPKRTLPLTPWGRISGVAFTPDGRHVATTNFNSTVYVLRLAAPAEGKGP
jgi:WD40 repeat protein/serine/threonine protein kinase